MIGDYDGTVLLVSHDRDFLDRVATTTVALKDGNATVYAGGWSDYAPKMRRVDEPVVKVARVAAEPEKLKSEQKSRGLSFTEKHRLEELPDVIARLEAEIGKLAQLLSDPELYSREPVKFNKATQALAERQEKLSAAEDEWLALEEKAQA